MRTTGPRRFPLLLAPLPALVGAAGWLGARRGLIDDRRTGISVSALPQDWWLAAGVALSLLALSWVVLARWRDGIGARRLGEQAAKAVEERRLLLSRLDHELKNPLTAMRVAVANVLANTPGDSDDAPSSDEAVARTAQRQGLRSIEEQAIRLSRLTADLRKIAEVRTGALDSGSVDLARVIEDAVDIVRDQPGAAGRQLRVNLPRAPWPLPHVVGDEDLLTLALVNLLDNAVKYTPVDGTIEVRAREAGGQVLVEIADTGPGIDPVDLPHIWDELYRSSRARAVPGSGLGLPLVRAVVERHGGDVSAESRLGRGTAIRIQVPVTSALPAGGGAAGVPGG